MHDVWTVSMKESDLMSASRSLRLIQWLLDLCSFWVFLLVFCLMRAVLCLSDISHWKLYFYLSSTFRVNRARAVRDASSSYLLYAVSESMPFLLTSNIVFILCIQFELGRTKPFALESTLSYTGNARLAWAVWGLFIHVCFGTIII